MRAMALSVTLIPYAGMTRIRFHGLARAPASQPVSRAPQ